MEEVRVGIKAIDTHVHLNDEAAIKAKGARHEQMTRYFGRERKPVSIDELADQYRARNMMAVLVNSTDVTSSGIPPVPNDHIADAVRKHPDVFIGLGAIDPWQGKLAQDEIKRCAEELGLRGLGELNPGRQYFAPNEPRFYPLWEEAAKHKLVVLFHGGMMGAGAGTPGGMGYKLKYGRPIPHLDDIAADFPELKIIGAHPSWPWQEESLAIARHKSNFYIDLSGWAPKYWPQSLVHYANTIIQDKVLFGSDWPALGVERWLEEFEQLPFKPEVRQKIMLDNATKLWGLEVS
ncbi:MAG: amidohydrolase family protein [Streptosporangiales bacterium]|nr:amidohydrolase family protein [Streptosporangiales bacterium]